MTNKEFEKELCKREGGKIQINAGQAREIRKILVEWELECAERGANHSEYPAAFIIDSAFKRLERRTNKKKQKKGGR